MTTATEIREPAGTGIRWIIAASSFAFVVTQLDLTIVNVALPRIALDLGVHVAGLQWVVDAYTLPFAVLMLSAGVLGDRFGSRRAYLFGLAIFAAASLGCGFAPNVATLIAGRAAQGAGAALLIPSSLALLNHAAASDHALRARAVGLWTAAGSVAIAAGPVTGGLLVASMGWRSIFLVNLPLCAIGIWMTLRWVPRDARAAQSRHLDPLGQLLAILAVTGLTSAVIEARPLGIGHPLILSSSLLAVVAGIAFYFAETKTSEPMLSFDIFHLQNFTPCMFFGTLLNLSYYGMIFVLSLYLQQARGYSALGTGLAYLPMMCTFIVSNLASGAAGARFGPRPPMIYGTIVMLAGFLMLAGLGSQTPYSLMVIPLVLIPAGMGFAIPAMTATVLSSVDRARSGTASAVINAARQTGGAIGVALFGALVGNTPAQIVRGLRTASFISVGLVFVSTLIAWKYVRRTHKTFAVDEEVTFQME